MRKITTAILTIASIFAFATPAFAADAPRQIIFEDEKIEGKILKPNEGISVIDLDTKTNSLVIMRDTMVDRMIITAYDL